MKFGFIGVGNMCSAILDGIVKTGCADAKEIYLFDTDSSKCQRFIDIGMTLCGSAEEVAKLSDVLFLCIKPQIMPKVFHKEHVYLLPCFV